MDALRREAQGALGTHRKAIYSGLGEGLGRLPRGIDACADNGRDLAIEKGAGGTRGREELSRVR